MTLERIRGLLQSKRQLLPAVLLGIALLAAVATLAKVTVFFVASAKAESIVKQAVAQSKSDPKVVETLIAKAKPLVDELAKQNLFSPPPPKENPVRNVLGIFGDEAWIDGKWYKAGDMVADAKILAIGPTSVTVEWDGSKKDFHPIRTEVAEAPGPKGGPPGAGGGPSEGPGEQRPEQITVQIQGGPEPGQMGMRGDFMMMRGRLGEMSPEERERFFREMRERRGEFGGGRGGPGGERGRGGRR